MSRVADAVERAALIARDDSFSDDDHPWGVNLGEHAGETPTVNPSALDRPTLDRPTLDPLPVDRLHAVPPSVVERPTPRVPRETTSTPKAQPSRGDAITNHPHLVALVERTFLPVSGEPPRSVAFTGLGVDSSVITAAAAELITQQSDATVCLVDANFSKPSLQQRFRAPDTAGLADLIASGGSLADAARPVGRNLWLLSAGASAGRPSLGSDAVRMRLAQFIARFDFVLVDIDPVSGPGEAAGFAPLVDGVILVIAADATRRESARRATEALRSAGASVLGAVLTNRRFPIPDPLYRRL